MTDYSLRFDNPVLQQRFLTELQRQKVPYGLGPNQAVECSSDEWSAVNAVAHVVRDGCFKWYFSWWKTQRETERFLEAVRKSGLPFELEHHKDGIVFLLARANATAYESVMDDLEPVHVLQMIDHCNLPVTDLERSQRFYERVLEPLGYHFLLRDGLAAGFGREAWNFGIVATPPPLPQLHVAFAAATRAMVDQFFAAALSAGATANGSPGIRAEYDPNYYAAFVRDLDGHNVEAVCRMPPSSA